MTKNTSLDNNSKIENRNKLKEGENTDIGVEKFLKIEAKKNKIKNNNAKVLLRKCNNIHLDSVVKKEKNNTSLTFSSLEIKQQFLSKLEAYQELSPRDLEIISKEFELIIQPKIEQLQAEINAVTSLPNARFDVFGEQVHELRAEVEEFIKKAKNKEYSFPDYKKGKQMKKYINPMDYVGQIFGKYLNHYNGGKGDFIYLFEIKILYPQFYTNSLLSYLSRNPNYKGIIPTKQDAVLTTHGKIEKSTESQMSQFKKVRSYLQQQG